MSVPGKNRPLAHAAPAAAGSWMLAAKGLPLAFGDGERVRRWLTAVVDACLAAVMLLAPLVMGGRHPLGQLALTVLVGTTTVAWLLRQCLTHNAEARCSGVEWLLLGGLLLLALQVAPLSPAILARLSPGTGAMLPLWSEASDGASAFPRWSQISLTPDATRTGLVMFLTNAMLFLIVVQRIGNLEDVEALLRWLAISAMLMAAIGLLQSFLGNGKFLWVYQHPFRHAGGAVKGPFINPNHFAHFLGLGIGPLIWWLQRLAGQETALPSTQRTMGRRRADGRSAAFTGNGALTDRSNLGRMALAMGLGLLVFAGLLTFSRGGVIVMFLASAACVIGLARWSLLGRKSLALLGGVAAIVLAALLIYGFEPLASELETIGAGSLDRLDSHGARRKLWAADLAAFSHFPLLGTGSGSHAEVYPTFYQDYTDVEYTYAESGYIQMLMECGATGFALLAVAAAIAGRWCYLALRYAGSAQSGACAVAVVSGLLISALHSVWDFVWFIPACASLTMVLLACACRLSQWTKGGARSAEEAALSSPRAVWIVALATVAAMVALMIGNRLPAALAQPYWDRYLRLVAAMKTPGAQVDAEQAVGDLMPCLQQTLERNPHDARARIKLAALCLRRFDLEQKKSDNPLPLAQIREAALTSQFPTLSAQDDWLEAVVGERRGHLNQAFEQVRRGLCGCPLQGEGYVFLAELAFLKGGGPGDTAALLQQALAVRPYQGAVLVAAGSEAALIGDTSLALRYWKRAFHQDPQCRSQIVELLAPRADASLLCTHFEPDCDGLQRIYREYRRLARDDQAREAAVCYLRRLIPRAKGCRGKEAAGAWGEASTVFQFLGDGTRAMACAAGAVSSAPNDYNAHRNLAALCLSERRYADAQEEFQWCLRRNPGDSGVTALLVSARRKQLELPAADTAQQLPTDARR